jgi:CRP-like cAMP-binding protein
MSKGISADAAGQGGILDWMHSQGKQRAERIPDFDAAQTLRLLRAARDISARDAGPTNFWAALTPTEQGDLISAARKRAFPAGTVLMHEGEPAENVMVILDGRTKVCIHESGRERVIAERGPGDIVGEGGRAPRGIRSATVIAIEPVLALIMTTEDFVVFAEEHPDLPDIVKQHVYARLTGWPDPPG